MRGTEWCPTSMKEPANEVIRRLNSSNAVLWATASGQAYPAGSFGPQDPAYTIGTPDLAPLFTGLAARGKITASSIEAPVFMPSGLWRHIAAPRARARVRLGS
jgi:hypothetical protein